MNNSFSDSDFDNLMGSNDLGLPPLTSEASAPEAPAMPQPVHYAAEATPAERTDRPEGRGPRGGRGGGRGPGGRDGGRGQGKSGCCSVEGPEFAHQAIDDAARRASRKQGGQGGVLRGGRLQSAAVQSAGGGFVAAEVGGADLHACGAQRLGGRDACRAADPASRNHRQLDRLHDLGQQGKGAPDRSPNPGSLWI